MTSVRTCAIPCAVACAPARRNRLIANDVRDVRSAARTGAHMRARVRPLAPPRVRDPRTLRTLRTAAARRAFPACGAACAVSRARTSHSRLFRKNREVGG